MPTSAYLINFHRDSICCWTQQSFLSTSLLSCVLIELFLKSFPGRYTYKYPERNITSDSTAIPQFQSCISSIPTSVTISSSSQPASAVISSCHLLSICSSSVYFCYRYLTPFSPSSTLYQNNILT
ncbi:hypothetical protein ACTXT7_000207 [Hymenolepis weldensis]